MIRKRISYLFIWLIIIFAWGWADLKQGNAQEFNRVGLVVQFGDDSFITRCIVFNENSLSGYEVLRRSGLQIEAAISALGVAICKINDEGCPPESCFCAYPNYWSYWHLEGNNWQYSPLGASSHYVKGGDVEGWRWGSGNPPVVISYIEICNPPTNTPTPTQPPPRPSQTAIPTLTSTVTLSPPSPTPTQTIQISSNPYPPPATPYTPQAYPPPAQQVTNTIAPPYPLPSQPTPQITSTVTPFIITPSPTLAEPPTFAPVIPTQITPPPFDLEKTETYRIIASATAKALQTMTSSSIITETFTTIITSRPISDQFSPYNEPLPNSVVLGYLIPGVVLFTFAIGVFMLITKRRP